MSDAKEILTNRQAFHEYHILDKYEAGAVLVGTEVKSMMAGRIQLKESYVAVKDNEVWLFGAHVSQYSHGNINNHDPLRPRKLLLNRRQIAKLHGAVARQGMTLVPLSIYFNSRGRAKVEIALAKGRKAHDKRDYEKEKDWKREQGRLMRQHG